MVGLERAIFNLIHWMCLVFLVYRVATSRRIRHYWDNIIPPNAGVSMYPCIYIYIYLLIQLYTLQIFILICLYTALTLSVQEGVLGISTKERHFSGQNDNLTAGMIGVVFPTILQERCHRTQLWTNVFVNVCEHWQNTDRNNDLWVEMSTSARPIWPHLAWWICHSGHCMRWWLLLCRTYELKIPPTLAPPGKRWGVRLIAES